MYRLLMLLSFTLISNANAAVEDGSTECSDGIDNDFDGAVDCSEPACISSMETCGLLPGPISVGLGLDKAYLTFDVPMATENGSASIEALVLDINGVAAGRDDVLITRPGSLRLFRNVVTPGYASLQAAFTTVPNFTIAAAVPRTATGDLNGDFRADLLVVDSPSVRRFLGDGNGGFTLLPTPSTGLPAIVAALDFPLAKRSSHTGMQRLS
jgi:hypothetical protein